MFLGQPFIQLFYLCCWPVELLRENVADAGQERFVGGEVLDVAITADYSELDVQREAREVEREGSPGEGRRQTHFQSKIGFICNSCNKLRNCELSCLKEKSGKR